VTPEGAGEFPAAPDQGGDRQVQWAARAEDQVGLGEGAAASAELRLDGRDDGVDERPVHRIQPLLVEADEFLATLAAAFSGCVVLDQPLTSYRFHSGNQFQYVVGDDRRHKRKATSLECLAKDLPSRLRAAGAAKEIVEFLTLPNWIDASRMRLSLGHGRPWETVRVERAAFRTAYKRASIGYYFFHIAVLAVAAVTPPSFFYSARDWYARRRLARSTASVYCTRSFVPMLMNAASRAN
jgi:hypothetical protein